MGLTHFIPDDERPSAAVSPDDPLPVQVVGGAGDDGGSTEATLVQVRDYLDTVETLLAQIRDRAIQVSAVPSSELAVPEGRAFFASSGRLQLAAAGNARLTFQNPAGSGFRLRLYQLVVAATNGPAWAKMFINPTLGLPATAPRTVVNQYVGHPNAGVAVLRADTNTLTPLSGGQDSGAEIAAFTGRTTLPFPGLLIGPGLTMGLNVPFTGAAEAEVTAYWWREAV